MAVADVLETRINTRARKGHWDRNHRLISSMIAVDNMKMISMKDDTVADN